MRISSLSLLMALLASGPTIGDVVRPGAGSPITGTTITIPESWGDRVGGNLFHTFEAFGVHADHTVTFTSDAPGIANVITRVIGGTPSKIDGTLSSTIPEANFFLLNPNGVFFGSGAVLKVPGSFVATTADWIELGKGEGVYPALPDAGGSILVSSPPSAFGFQSEAPAPIGLAGALLETGQHDSTSVGRTVALIGGDITIRDTNPFDALKGDIVVASVGGSGKVEFDAGNRDSIPTTSGFEKLGAITIRNATLQALQALEPSGLSIGGIDLIGRSLTLDGGRIFSNNRTDVAAMPIRIRVTDGVLFKNNSRIESSTGGGGKAADIEIDAGRVDFAPGGGWIRTTVNSGAEAGDIALNISGDLQIGAGSELLSRVGTGASAKGGDIRVSAYRIHIDGGYVSGLTGIRSVTSALNQAGVGGSVTLDVVDSIEVIRHGSIDVITSPASVANGGDLQLTSGALILGIQELLSGDPTNILTGINGRTAGAGDGGTLGIHTGNLSIVGGARIDGGTFPASAAAPTTGNGGVISVNAGNIVIDGSISPLDSSMVRRTGIVSFAGEGLGLATGNAGDIVVNASGSIRLLNGGLIDSSTFQTGDAGNVSVYANSILIDRGGRGIFTGIGSDTELSQGGGRAGDVTVSASGLLELNGGGLISAATFGSGAAGNVMVSAGSLRVAGAGVADPSVVVENSGIVAVSGADSTGDGGSVTVNVAGRVEIGPEGLVAARALGTGSAGSVMLRGDAISLNGSSLSVLSAQGDAGSLGLNALNDISGKDVLLSANAGNDGGNILLEAGGLIRFQGSRISADAGGSGGNIEFRGARHLVLDNTPVSASAVERDGGNILVSTGTFFANNSPLSVTSERGAPGTVRIETIHSLSGSEEVRDVDWLDPDDVLQPSCAERRPDAGSSFTRGGRGGTQRLPGGHLPAFRLIQ